jgi:hypothetical protein
MGEPGISQDQLSPPWVRAFDALIAICREQRKNAEENSLGSSGLRAFFCHLVNGKSRAGWIDVGGC